MMHLFSVVLLVVAASLACAAEDTTSMRFPRGYLDEKDSAPVQRFLRVYDNENDEERAPVGNVLNSIMTSTLNAVESAKLKVFLLKKSSGVDVLNSFKLGDDASAALKNSKLETLNKYVVCGPSFQRSRF
ncbi:secreted RxLR effector peptide protein, putative [Phytophthora infestans T30-4]|uniref:Secreted RxLR effector peptide protein, putative n=1 Tax=Phytophthora infestans (strain T30-4) TaxID=403677 RepID=D0P4P6_PHYIT|nr:secreted RxLR effector peptide protein, putative [Phytophthora infestans T30-4]EEY68671.1 secreted RxLR effector peptide protein, putative [Phytophthora infestans T30-4]|eukprot:XP_002996907.1 secreted RxLR effector peptide protein, putative [Phytophthora infestans T30-4]